MLKSTSLKTEVVGIVIILYFYEIKTNYRKQNYIILVILVIFVYKYIMLALKLYLLVIIISSLYSALISVTTNVLSVIIL